MKWVRVGSVSSTVVSCLCLVPCLGRAQDAPPQAHVIALRGALDVESPEAHPAMEGETLLAGQHVHTQPEAHATLALPGDVMLDLGPNSSVVLFAPATPPAHGAPSSADTSLVRGVFHVRVDAPSNAPPSDHARATLALPGGTLTLRVDTETSIEIGADHVARVAVLHGSARLRGVGRDAAIHANHGARVDTTHTPVVPIDLPTAPTWQHRPPSAVLLTDASRPVEGTLAPPPFAPGPVAVTHWHVQVARDVAFHDMVSDATQPARETHVTTPPLGLGTYFVRASAVDGEHFEGSFSAPVQTRIVSPPIAPAGPGHRAFVTVPDGFFCGLDGAAPQPHGTALPLAPGRPHSLRCSELPSGADAVELPLRAELAGALSHDLHFNPAGFDSNGGTTVVVLVLRDPTGAPLSYANVRIEASPGVSLEPLREGDQRGVYTSTLQWPRGTHGVRLHVVINDGESFDATLGSP